MTDLLELTVRCGEDPRKPVQTFAYHNVENEDTAPRYEFLYDALQDGWQVASVMRSFEAPMKQVFQTFWLQRVRHAYTTSGWHQQMDPEEPNFGPPNDERTVMVMLNGHIGIGDEKGRNGGPHGINFGWFDHDRRVWYVNGSRKHARWVTHWHEIPPEPLQKG